MNKDLNLILTNLNKTKAEDVVAIDVSKISSITDYFVLASATSTTAVRALSDNLSKDLKNFNIQLLRQDGEKNASWIVQDYGNIIVHIFLKEVRELYNLERLWNQNEDLTRFSVKEDAEKKAKSKKNPGLSE